MAVHNSILLVRECYYYYCYIIIIIIILSKYKNRAKLNEIGQLHGV